ncbi:restriction endonuclease subunit S [Idiomarina sp. ST10R2A5]|uniref:restriction endonuclease subunit S n=1 Tax=Idiomarina sp. ST10R2A5 TaxID=3418368 RepID=UPI003EC92728
MTLNTYKDIASCQILGIESLPAHWSENKLGYLFNLGKGLTITKQDLVDEGIPCLNYGEVHSKYGFEVNPTIHPLKCVPKSYLQTNLNALLESGDFVFADTSEDIEGAGNFSQLVSKQPTFAGYHTIIARPSGKIFPRFFAYLFHSEEFRNQIRLLVKGVKVFSISQGILKSAPVWLPTYEEQQKIAQFLDHETSKIDALIDEQKRLIELLKEKRQAVISHAVTKGLNPDAPMKDSGVEWLGEVPEHWEVASLKTFIRLVESGTSVNAADTPASEGELGVLKTSAVYGDELDVNQNKTVVKEEESRVSCQLKANRLIVSRMNTPELVGATGFSLANPGNLFLPDRLWQITLENVEAQFIFMFTLSKSYRSQIKLVCAGASSSMQNIAQEDFKNVKVAVPPLIEQKDIVEEWHRFKSNSNQLMEQAEKTVKLLQERRSALISAAVTGKIDVRDWQPPAGSDTVDSNASVQTERHYG